MDKTLFIGLVTHAGSRFPESSGKQGLMAQLAGALRPMGWHVVCATADRDEADESSLDTGRSAVRASICAELDAEARWFTFQRGRAPDPATRLVLRLRKVYRHWTYLRTATRASTAGRRMLLRLANIELSHMRLLREGANSGAQWILILEDDAITEDPYQLARDLDTHLTDWMDSQQPRYVNVSRSFPLSKLRLAAPLVDEGQWDATTRIVSSTIPFTNTVCAILYRNEFLQELVHEMDTIPMQPIVPIDWKLNLAIMNASSAGLLGPSDCYTLDPAPIVQGSMHQAPREDSHG